MSGKANRGVLVLVVGPSGAGKDTLIARAKPRLGPGYRFPRRVVTRPASRWEDHDSLDAAEFERQETSGAFALSWRAHGLAYGLPASIGDDLEAGLTVVCNVSRASVSLARERFANVRVVCITANPQVRAARIAARGRDLLLESRTGIGGAAVVPTGCDAVIDNSGDLDAATEAFLRALTAARQGN